MRLKVRLELRSCLAGFSVLKTDDERVLQKVRCCCAEHAVVQSRYLEKLKLLGLEEKDDPYEASNSYKFIDDLHDRLLRPCTHNSTVHHLI